MSRRLTAYHEAGHAVATVLVDEYVHSIWISPSGRPERVEHRKGGLSEPIFGRVETSADEVSWIAEVLAVEPSLGPKLRAKAQKRVFIDGAGMTAEAKAARKGAWYTVFHQGGSGDYACSDVAMSPFIPDANERRRAILRAWDSDRRRITTGRPWRAVEAVARRLLREPFSEEIDWTGFIQEKLA